MEDFGCLDGFFYSTLTVIIFSNYWPLELLWKNSRIFYHQKEDEYKKNSKNSGLRTIGVNWCFLSLCKIKKKCLGIRIATYEGMGRGWVINVRKTCLNPPSQLFRIFDNFWTIIFGFFCIFELYLIFVTKIPQINLFPYILNSIWPPWLAL